MFRMFIASLFATVLLVSGCATAPTGCRHKGCHKIGARPAGRNNGITHHHYAKPQALAEEKK